MAPPGPLVSAAALDICIYIYTYPIHIYIYTHIYNIHPWVGHDLLSRSCEKATTVMKSVSSPNIIENM